MNNFHEYLIQHSLKSGGAKDHFRQVKVPGTAPYWKACKVTDMSSTYFGNLVNAWNPALEATNRLRAENWASNDSADMMVWSPSFSKSPDSAPFISLSLFSANRP